MTDKTNLNMENLETVTGGEASGNGTRTFFAEYDGHTYEMWRSNSGYEKYVIDGQEVQPSRFYKEYYGVGR